MANIKAPDKIAVAGDVNIEDITIITSQGFAQAITEQVIGIDIYEDLFSPFITGQIHIKDSQNLTNLFPLVGEEVVRIQVKTPTLPDKDSFTGDFAIYKMDDKANLVQREAVYTLHFISREAIVDLNKKISKAYSGKISDIATKVLQDPDALETKKPINVEETQNTFKYISNFWGPVKNLQYLTESAVSKSDSPSYIFFENKYGFHFVSLEALYDSAPFMQRFVKDNYTADVGPNGSSRRSIEKDYQRVIEFIPSDSFNYMDRLQSGMYGSEIVYYDIMTKQYVHKAFVPTFTESKHLNPYPLYSTKVAARPKALLIHETQYYNNFEGFDVLSNTKIRQKRAHLLSQAEAFKLNIIVFGRTDYTCGQKVYVEVPKTAQTTKEDTDTEDKMMSGFYLISALCHNITREKHQCSMELIKDSIKVNLNDPK